MKKQRFRSDFLTGEANWVWNEWGIFNTVILTPPRRCGTAVGSDTSVTSRSTSRFAMARGSRSIHRRSIHRPIAPSGTV